MQSVLPELCFDFEIIHLLLTCFQTKEAASSLCSGLRWPCPGSSRCRAWHGPSLRHTHPEGLVHGGISSHSQRNQMKTTSRQKQNVVKEEQNFCEYSAKQQQFCTGLTLRVSCIKLIVKMATTKYCSKGWGQGRRVPLLLIYFALLLQGKFKREVKGGRCSMGAFPKQKGLLDRKRVSRHFDRKWLNVSFLVNFCELLGISAHKRALSWQLRREGRSQRGQKRKKKENISLWTQNLQ